MTPETGFNDPQAEAWFAKPPREDFEREKPLSKEQIDLLKKGNELEREAGADRTLQMEPPAIEARKQPIRKAVNEKERTPLAA
mgnify:CR=1 FL=1